MSYIKFFILYMDKFKYPFIEIHYMFKHISGEKEEKFDPKDEFASYLISDRNGSFFSQGVTKNHTFYHGLLTQYPEEDGWTMAKFIERISIESDDIEKEGDTLTFLKDDERSTIRFNAERKILFETDGEKQLRISLDPRKIYDFSEFGREIKVYEESGILIAEYTSYEGEKIKYRLFLGIRGAQRYEFRDEWIRRDYDFDAKRSGNGTWYINNGLDIKFEKELLIAQDHDKERLLAMMNKDEEPIEDTSGTILEGIEKKKHSIAYDCAIDSMNELSVGTEGIYAGFYWFFQFWTRDEAISLGGAIREEKKDLVKNIILRHLDSLLKDGRISNRFPHSQLGSADGIGWSILRLGESRHLFNEDELRNLSGRMEISMRDLEHNYKKEGLFMNGPKETWMDTNGNTNDVRDGFRVEIQALMLNYYRELARMTEKEEYIKKEDNMRHKTREIMFDGAILADGADETMRPDKTIRPNIFLAYYIYPKLLTETQWEKTFDNAIEALWLDWGGMSTIDKKNPLFKPEYTGENDESYHRGDSWFFVNNIAAMAMYRLNKEKYKTYIQKIVNASSEDILYKGILGGASEVSSAKEQRAEGALHQAWSACTFIELMHEIHR